MPEHGSVTHKDLPDGRRAWVVPMMFNARICVGDPGAGSYDQGYCYHSIPVAAAALDAWDGTGEPAMWKKNLQTGEYREPAEWMKEMPDA